MKSLVGKIILVVDDEPLLQEIFSDELMAHGAKVVVAGNGETAYQLLKANPEISVVITDEMMPNMSGLELIQKINESIIPKPVVFLCSGATGIAEKVSNLQIKEIFEKPLDWIATVQIIIQRLS